MIFVFNYATPSVFQADRERALLGLSAERPVRFSGLALREVPLLRFALRAFGEALWSWRGGDSWFDLDPVVTVYPDRLYFEGFSADLSAYVQLQLDTDLFEIEGELRPGTTSVDFNAWLWGALGELRSSRETRLTIDPAGFEVATAGAGGRFAPEVEVPEPFLRGMMELQAAQTLPGTRLVVRPVDLLAPIRFLRYAKGRVSPRALRYELDPGQPARIVLEPWEKSFVLHDTVHGADEPRKVRTWGRDRLRLLESLLPFAESAEIFLKGRGMPTFFLLHLPGMRFLVGLSGWSARSFLEPGFSLLVPSSEHNLATELYDVGRKEYRPRELFNRPLELELSDVRLARVPLLKVELASCQPQETRKTRRFKTPEGVMEREVIYRDWKVEGRVDGRTVEAVVNERGRTIFATCDCPFFQEHLLTRGPCEHILALVRASDEQRVDTASSLEAERGEDDE